MALKGILDKIEDAPESLREHYTQSEDGKFVLAVSDDHQLRSKAQKLLEEKKAAKSALDDLAKRYEGLDPEEYKRLRGELEEVRAGKGETVGKILSERQRQLQEEWGQKVSRTASERDAAKQEAEAYKSRYADKLLSDGFRALLDKEKIRLRSEGAFNDLVRRAGGQFTADLASGKIITRTSDGIEDPKSPSEWLRERLRDASDAHLFEDSNGGGATGSGGRRVGGMLYITRAELMKPSPEQAKVIATGKYVVTD
jgi:hypothetical protein